MCEAATPLSMLRSMRFALASLAEMAGQRGSCERQNISSACKGIRADLDWCIAQLETAGEGEKNMCISAYAHLNKKPSEAKGA